MEAFSVTLKILSALAVIVGFANLILGMRGTELGKLSPAQVKLVGAALLVLAVILGVADHLTGKKASAPGTGISVGNIDAAGGEVVVGARGPVTITRQTVERLELHPGDSPEEKARKRAQAKRIVAQDVLANLRSLDARLPVVEALQVPDATGERLADIRRRVAPSLQQGAGEGYDKLMAEQGAAALRQAFNSAPLGTDRGEAMVRLLQETESDPSAVRRFTEALGQVDEASDRLVEVARAPAVSPSASSEELREASAALQAETLRLAVEAFENKARIAHLHGLVALDALAPDPAVVVSELSALRHLGPRRPLDAAEARALLSSLTEREAVRVGRVKELLEQRRAGLDRSLAGYAELDRQLEINSGDPWNMVVGKAISLRQLGRTGEAVAAFARYGELFGDDPGSERYVRIAQTFTVQARNLGVEGGVYVHELLAGSTLAGAGLRTGDVIVEYAGKPVRNMTEMTDALAGIPFGRAVRVGYLRFDEKGGFAPRRATLTHGTLGAGFMPI